MEKIYEESKDVHASYLVYVDLNELVFANKEFTEYLDKDEFVRAFKSNEIVLCLGPVDPAGSTNGFAKVLAVKVGDTGVDCYCALDNIMTFHIAEKPEESGSEGGSEDDEH